LAKLKDHFGSLKVLIAWNNRCSKQRKTDYKIGRKAVMEKPDALAIAAIQLPVPKFQLPDSTKISLATQPS